MVLADVCIMYYNSNSSAIEWEGIFALDILILLVIKLNGLVPLEELHTKSAIISENKGQEKLKKFSELT